MLWEITYVVLDSVRSVGHLVKIDFVIIAKNDHVNIFIKWDLASTVVVKPILLVMILTAESLESHVSEFLSKDGSSDSVNFLSTWMLGLGVHGSNVGSCVNLF